jgi:hypothetical protein
MYRSVENAPPPPNLAFRRNATNGKGCIPTECWEYVLSVISTER